MFDPPRVGHRLALAVSALAISLLAFFAVAPQVAWAADDDIASGDCGTCVWTIDANGKLTIAPEDGKSGQLPQVYSADSVPWYPYRADIKTAVVVSGVKAKEYCRSLFRGCSKLIGVDLTGLDVSGSAEIDSMFYGCQRLKTVDLSPLSLSGIKSTSWMFKNCSTLSSVNLGGVEFSSLADASEMFYGCSSLAAVDMSFLLNSNLEDMREMFRNCSKLSSVDLSGLFFRKTTSTERMFSGCSGLKTANLAEARLPKLDSMMGMFEDCSSLLSADLSNLYIHGASDLRDLFASDESLKTVLLDGLDCDAAQSLSGMFYECDSLSKVDFSRVKAGSVQDMSGVFDDCSSLDTVDLSGIDSLVTSSGSMFSGCKRLRTIFDDGGLSVSSGGSWTFGNCGSLRGGNGTTYNDNRTDSRYARIDKPDQPGYFTCKHSGIGKVEEVAPSSGKDGSIAHYECSVCGESFEDASAKEELKPEDLVIHVWGAYYSNGNATCTKDGTKTRNCPACGKSETVSDEGSKVGHKPGKPKIENVKAATCTADGSHDEVTYCTVCEVELARDKVTDSKLDHKPGGVKVEKVEHPSCTEDGSHDEVVYCTVCKQELSRRTVGDSATGHDWSSWFSYGDATCTKDGTKGRYCSACRKTERVSDGGSAFGHDTATEISTKPAGLDSDGYIDSSQVCKRCGWTLSSDRTSIASVESISLASVSLTCSGKDNRPSVRVTDAEGNVLRAGTDYSVSYADNGRDVGTHRVTVKGKGGYSFTKDLSFVVNPKGTSLSKVTGAKKALTVKWKKASGANGYQLRLSTKSNMAGAKSTTVKSAKTTSKKVTKLKKKTKYYVQVRTYKVVKGKTYWSGWSKAKSVKTK